MRVYAIALAVMLTAQPAWAHHKPNHPDFPRTPSAVQIARDPCGVSHAPRQNPGFRALGEHCRRLLAQYRASLNDSALRDRCNRAAMARTGRLCEPHAP
jgi:hypothetical protein